MFSDHVLDLLGLVQNTRAYRFEVLKISSKRTPLSRQPRALRILRLRFLCSQIQPTSLLSGELYKVWVVDFLEFIDLLIRHSSSSSSSSSSSLQQAQQASKLLCNKIVDFLFRGSEQILPRYLSYPTTDCMFLDYIF